VSHELRTPLARIRVALDLAAEGDAESARQALADIAEDWGDLDRLVEDVLAAARLDLGGTVRSAPALRVEPLELGPVLERAAARFRLAHPGRELSLEADDPLPAIVGDAAMLTRVLDNLLDNARKYSDVESPVAMRARAHDDAVIVEIADHGIGIDPDDLPHVGTPFFRGDRSRARTTGGVGLGLALARRIVEGHGGRLDVDSAPAAGTTVRVTLPNIPRTSGGEQIGPSAGSN
jgi:signal transduction histidine kinase